MSASINLLRNTELASQHTDDTIIIQKQNELTCVVTYTDSYSGVRHCFAVATPELPEYLYNLLDLLRLDDDPFKALQLNARGFPSIMMNLPLSRGARTTIIDVIRDVICSYDRV
jgi:hypothetical protein